MTRALPALYKSSMARHCQTPRAVFGRINKAKILKQRKLETHNQLGVTIYASQTIA